jgi:NADH-quinone oxidoreductase subunit L
VLRVDALSAVMILVVTGVGFLIHVYSLGYMGDDPRFTRYFAFLNLFTCFMLILVLGGSILLMFIGWEGVGLCSYLLIGFWFEKTENALAGMKAFIVNRVGDFGFTVGMLVLFVHVGMATGIWTLDFKDLGHQITQHAGTLNASVLTLAAILLFVGATGKSAQIPLYVWLPDAMAGPTPVSALIHAATMVTAGVYLVARMNFLFEAAPVAMAVVAGIGALTALFAGTIGICQNDIKKVLAYSTVSQLGYMFVGVGVGAFASGIWHLYTHAFFKACLFLSSGLVIYACHHEQDIRRMGGLARRMPKTACAFGIATLAIAGAPGLSGWFSKDAILAGAAAWHAEGVPHWFGPAVAWVGIAGALVTAFYMTRLYARTFFGEYRGGHDEHGTHEDEHGHGGGPKDPPWVMTGPVLVLALLSIVGAYPFFFDVPRWLEATFGTPQEHAHPAWVMPCATGAGIAGILLGLLFYVWKKDLPERIASGARGLYELVRDKYRVDEAYQALVVRPAVELAESMGVFDNVVIDGAVNGSAAATATVSRITGVVDNEVVDGAVNAAAEGTLAAGHRLRRLQSGDVRRYVLVTLVGALFLIALVLAVLMARGL